jgi:integrase/recombinase XerD
MKKNRIGPVIYNFFEDYLKTQKGLRSLSVRSYRDVLRLFLVFVSKDAHRKITGLSLQDFTAERLIHFLKYLENERGNQISTRNHRLSVLHSFFQYIARRDPEFLIEAERVANIPFKRVLPPETLFLERDQVQNILDNLALKDPLSLRDRTLIMFLYNTGARVQEVADLRLANLDFEAHRVHLQGKGGKWRVCPFWKETASLLKVLIDTQKVKELDAPIFVSRQGRALTRFGIYKIVVRHSKIISLKGANAKSRSISPHVFRHTTAMHLLESGVEPNVIRSWLGHVDLDTTYRYAEINIRAKHAALRVCEPPSVFSVEFQNKTLWRDDENLLKWLDTL